MNYKKIIIAVFAALAMATLSQAKEWRGIVPLHSTRDDVIRLLGPTRDTNDLRSIYHLEKEEVYIVFSSKNFCDADTKKVPLGTVLLIQITPSTKLPLTHFQVDKKKFRRFDPSQSTEFQGYIDDEEGLMIRGHKELVDKVFYIASAKDRDLCPAYYANPERFAQIMVEFLPRKFDEYSDIPLSDEKARLDNFAIYLQKDEPEFKGYIIVYTGRTTRSGEAQARAKRAKDYLVKVRGIDAARIVTIDGGCREQLEVELYALPNAMSPPTPNPSRKE